MADKRDDSHLAPSHYGESEDDRDGRMMSARRFVGNIGRFVRLAERQGTRLVDQIERWVDAHERQAEAMERQADAMERLAGSSKDA